MSKQASKEVLPQLRFPEFRDAAKWEVKKLGEIASFYKGKGLPKSAITPKGKNLCVHYGELFTVYQEVIETITSRTDIKDKSFLSVENDVLMPTSDVTPKGLAKASCIKQGSVILGGDILVIRTHKSKMCGEFISRHIRHLEQKVLQLVSGSTVFHLYASSIDKLALSFPSFKEQQKIADCLSTVDNLITTQAQKVDALKAHKKGLMQQLFPVEGETVPRLRFPEFLDSGEWEDKKLGGLSQIVRGGSPRPIDEYITTDVDGLNWLKIADVDKGSKYVTFTKERVLVTALSKTRVVKPGDLIMSNSMSFGRPYILKIESCIHDGWIAVTSIDEGANRDYLYYLILSPTSQKYFVNNAAGSGVQNLNADIIKLLPVLIPKYSEQQKIADCLSSFDELLDVQAKKLDALKAHKKGLMQQLFPSVDEVN